MNGLIIVRVVFVAVALTLSAVLIARGNVLIGVLVGVLAILRLVMFLGMMRRRKAFRQRFPRRWEQPERGNDRWT